MLLSSCDIPLCLCNPVLFHQQTYIFNFNDLKAENQYHSQPRDDFNYPKSNYSSCMKIPSYVRAIHIQKMRVKM